MSMADRDGFIWYDGKLVPWRDANTHVLTHSLHYGLAVFEGVRAYKTVNGTAIFRLKEHTDRLFNSAHIYRMTMPYDKETLMAAQKEVVRANQLESAYIRPIAFYGSEKMGVSPKGAKVHISIAAWPWGAYLGEEGMEKGIRVKTSSYARHHVNVSMCRAKYSGTYANSILANMEATEQGYDEALLLDVDGAELRALAEQIAGGLAAAREGAGALSAAASRATRRGGVHDSALRGGRRIPEGLGLAESGAVVLLLVVVVPRAARAAGHLGAGDARGAGGTGVGRRPHVAPPRSAGVVLGVRWTRLAQAWMQRSTSRPTRRRSPRRSAWSTSTCWVKKASTARCSGAGSGLDTSASSVATSPVAASSSGGSTPESATRSLMRPPTRRVWRAASKSTRRTKHRHLPRSSPPIWPSWSPSSTGLK